VTDLMRLTAEPVGPIDDPVLDALDGEARAAAALFSPMGDAAAIDDDPDQPYDLQLMKPFAVDLERLCELAGSPVPPLVGAALGARRAVLLCHAMTAFAPPGERPGGVWGMGYEVGLVGVDDASTISLSPDSEVEQLGAAHATVDLGLSAGGKLSLPAAAISGLPLPLTVPGIELRASTDDRFSVSIGYALSVVQVQAGPIGAGGARWNLYRHGRDLRLSQSLLQTVMIPDSLKSLDVSIRTWIRKRSLLGGARRSCQWTAQPVQYRLSLQ
jgi:hypothetical protein